MGSDIVSNGVFSSRPDVDPVEVDLEAVLAEAEEDDFLRNTGIRVRAVKKTNLAINAGSLNIAVKLSPSISAGSTPVAETLEGIANLASRSPIDAVTYDQLAEPAAVVSQKILQSTPTTPQATFIPDQGTMPIARIMSSRRHMLGFVVGVRDVDGCVPIEGSEGSDRFIGVTCSVWVGREWVDKVEGGADSGAKAALTRERGFGNRTAMSGARGRERRYDPKDPVAVIMVNNPRAGMGDKSDPTKILRTIAPGTDQACFQHPTNVRTATVWYQPISLDVMYVFISAERSWTSVVDLGRCRRVVLFYQLQFPICC